MFRGLLMVVFFQIIMLSKASNVEVGDACRSNAECNHGEYALHHSKCDQSTCQCVDGYFGQTSDAICTKPILGDDCGGKPANYCSIGVANSECESSTSCICKANYFQKGGDSSRCYKVESGSPCNSNADTDVCASSVVANLSCDSTNEQCSCREGYIVSEISSACVKQLVSDDCNACTSTNGICVDVDEDGVGDECICPANKQMSDSSDIALGCDVGKAEIGDFCDGEAVVCYRENSNCAQTHVLTNEYSCACDEGYIAIPIIGGNGDHECVSKIETEVDPNCETCEGNNGACYDRDGDYLRDGCLCPLQRSSSDSEDYTKDCDQSVLAVECLSTSMKVRYTPFNDSEITSLALDEGEAVIYIQGKRDRDPCVFESEGDGSWFLDLSLKEAEFKQCGTRKTRPSDNEENYENRVWVQKSSDKRGKSDICFEVFCSYKTKAHASSADRGHGVAVIRNTKKSKAGKKVKPDLSIDIHDEYGRDATTTGVKLGSPAQIVIERDIEEAPAYVDMKVENCAASTEPSPSSISGTSVVLMREGCAVKGFNISLTQNNDNTQTSLSFPIFLIGDGKENVLFFHCSVIMCREEGQCAPSDCTEATRRRRMALSPAPPFDPDTLTESLHSRAVRVLPSDKFYKASNKDRVFYSEGEKQNAFFSNQMVTITIAVLVSVIVTIAIVAVAVIMVIRRSAAMFQTQQTPQPSPPASEC